MNKFVKSILALGITSALGLASVNAATYKITDKGSVASLKYTYAQQENNVGEMAISGTSLYNFPVQFQYLVEKDYDAVVALARRNYIRVHELSDIENEELLRAGTPTANDLSWVIRYLRAANTSLSQKVGDVIAMANISGQTEEMIIFDTTFENTSELTRSTIDFVNGITDNGWLYGNASAPYLPIDFTESDGDEVTHWLRSFTTRGYFSPDQGQTIIPLMPPAVTYGGESAILDISDSQIAVGYASIGLDQDAVDFIEDTTGGCADPDINMPIEVCIQNIASGIYHLEAYKWHLDINGEVSSEGLGYLVTFHVDDTSENVSRAQAVNNHGVAVGYAIGWVDETETQPSVNEQRLEYAVVFKDGQVVSLTEDHGKEYISRAFDINDNGIAVGSTHGRELSSRSSTTFYYVDTSDLNNMTMEMPKGFFTGSTSRAMAINENNLIVGTGEVETHNASSGNPRRTHGFIYDIAEKTFIDLNDFLPCESEYTIFEAVDINENNEISASAIVKVPRKDSKGELMLGEAGEQLFEDVVRAVKMSPITGEIENCTKVEAAETKRQGAGLGFMSMATLILFGLRRRFIHK